MIRDRLQNFTYENPNSLLFAAQTPGFLWKF